MSDVPGLCSRRWQSADQRMAKTSLCVPHLLKQTLTLAGTGLCLELMAEPTS